MVDTKDAMMEQNCYLVVVTGEASCPLPLISDSVPSACRTVVQADIVFLADDSWGVGQSSFSLVKDFISALISSFKGSVVGTEGVRFGVTVFGDIPR